MVECPSGLRGTPAKRFYRGFESHFDLKENITKIREEGGRTDEKIHG